MHRMRANLARRSIQRWVGCVPGGDRKQKQQRDQQQQQPEKHIQRAVSRGRKDNRNWLHGFCAPAQCRPEFCREQAKGAGQESQSSFYYPCGGSRSRRKTPGGNLGVDPLPGRSLQRSGLDCLGVARSETRTLGGDQGNGQKFAPRSSRFNVPFIFGRYNLRVPPLPWRLRRITCKGSSHVQ